MAPNNETIEEFLDRMERLLEFKKAVHTNPVEVGIVDLERLIYMSKRFVAKQLSFGDGSYGT